MSKLTISSPVAQFALNVISFTSPMYGTIASAQTRTLAVQFPIKMSQPDIEFQVVFTNQDEFERFQKFIRNNQQSVLGVTSLLTLNWPQRNILNWTGVVKSFRAGGMRANYAPTATFSVDLVDSMVSSRSDYASIAPSWHSIVGEVGMGPDAVLTPSTADLQYLVNTFGLSQPSGGLPGFSVGTVGGAATLIPFPATPPAAPAPPGAGILTGTG